MRKCTKKTKGATFVELALVFAVIIAAFAGYSLYSQQVNSNIDSKYFAAAGTLNRIMAEDTLIKVGISGNINPHSTNYSAALAPILENIENSSNYEIELCLAAVKKSAVLNLINSSAITAACALPSIDPNLCGSDYCLVMFPQLPSLQAELPPVLVGITPKVDEKTATSYDGSSYP